MANHPEPAPATYANLAGETFTYKPGTASEWAEAEMEEDGGKKE